MIWLNLGHILTPRIRYSYCCSVTEKPDVMVLAPVMVLAYVMVDGEADMVVNKEADIVVDDVADMEVDKVALWVEMNLYRRTTQDNLALIFQ